MSDFYSYVRDQDETESYSYAFFTDKGNVYSITFETMEYQDFLQEFPVLLEDGYGLNIFCTWKDKEEKRTFDGKVKTTIFKIINDHFENAGHNSVLIYHCDTSDGFERYRHILFNQWYNECETKDEYVKESLSVEIPLPDGTKKHYIGYISKKANENLEKISEEFDQFSYYIVQNDLMKNGGI